jgi:hypothetical protein
MLDFLKQVQVTAPEVEIRKASGPRKQRNPENADIRLFSDGSVYPSAMLAEKFRLEYGNKPTEKGQSLTGYGFDVIDSEEFKQYLNTPVRCIWVSPVPRSEGKIDMFASTSYNEDGTPKSSVLDQGTVTFGRNTLIPMIESAYGITLNEETKEFSNGKRYVDFILAGPDKDTPFTLPPGKTLAFVPKAKERGEEKGMATVVRRENPEFWCLYPAPETAVEAVAADVEEVSAD